MIFVAILSLKIKGSLYYKHSHYYIMKVLPPRIFQLAIVAIIVIHFVIPIKYLYDSLIRFIGVIPILTGTYLNIYTDILFKKRKTTIKPSEEPSILIEDGPFRYSRNPVYLGMVLIILGCSLISGSILSLLVPVIFTFIIHYKYILIEEAILEKCFGDKYLNYKRKVRCWM